MKNNVVFYEQPQIEVVEIEVEQGFASTGGLNNGGTNKEEGWGEIN